MSFIEHPLLRTHPGALAPPGSSMPHLEPPYSEFGWYLDACLRTVETGLASEAGIQQARDTLDALAILVRTQEGEMGYWDYAPFLRRLTQIYAAGCQRRENTACTGTAAAYAAIVEAVSRRLPAFDFTDTLGQLLEFMTRLFSAQENDWKVVYAHLRAIPDVIDAKQSLIRVCSADIREWFDAGVQNLFSLRQDLTEKIQELVRRTGDLEARIRAQEQRLGALRQRLARDGQGKILSLEDRFLERELARLRDQQASLTEERAGQEEIRQLIESDIREFERFLREARRAYYLRLVS